MRVYVVSQDGCFRASFPTQEEANGYMAAHALHAPGTTWTIDTYVVASGDEPEAPALKLVR